MLRQAVPGAGVSLILDTLRRTGLPITDTRPAGVGTTVPRVSVFDALQSLKPASNPPPTLTSVSPNRLRAGALSPVTLTLTGSNFNAFSVAYWNGVAKPTTVLSTTLLQATIPITDLASVGTVPVWVATPAPGGGLSAAVTVTLDPPPSLTVSATSVAPSTSVTTTLTSGFGGPNDWLALAATGSPLTSYISFTYVGSGVTSRTWTVTMPSAPGQYEFRLFLNNVYTLAATSPVVRVDAGVNPPPTVTSLSPASVPAGASAFTLTVTGTGFVASSVVRWNGASRSTTFVSATQLQAAIPATDVSSVGSNSVSVVTPAPGGGTSVSVAFNATPPPALSVSSTTATPGGSVTATLTNGGGGVTDWLAFAATTAPNTSYIQYVYVGAGVTTRTWTVTVPSTAGSYEFRYFPNGGNTRAATSPAVTVQTTGSTVPAISSLAPSSSVAGGPAFNLTVNGSNFTSTSVVRWNGADRPTTFVSASQLTAAIASADIVSVGSASVTVFSPPPGGGTSTAATFTISAGSANPPVLSVSAAAVSAGAPVTVTLTGGTGGSGDWLSFAPTTAANSSYVTFTYVGTGVTTRTWTVTTPLSSGTYEFRLFPNNGYTRAATSPPVTVTLDSNPIPSATSLSPARLGAGTGAFTLTINGSGFVPSSVVRWNGSPRPTTLVNSSQLTASIAAADIAATGTAQVTVFSPTPGGGTSAALAFTIAPPPTLTVSATTVAPGASVTVTLTDGFGGPWDWLAFAPTSASNISYVTYTFVGGGVSTRTWTVTVPSTPGAYEFRLFLNNGYTRAATSPTVTVQ